MTLLLRHVPAGTVHQRNPITKGHNTESISMSWRHHVLALTSNPDSHQIEGSHTWDDQLGLREVLLQHQVEYAERPCARAVHQVRQERP